MTIQNYELSANLLEAILWQYNDAERIVKMIENDQYWYDINIIGFFEKWYNDVFNVDTATDFGLPTTCSTF